MTEWKNADLTDFTDAETIKSNSGNYYNLECAFDLESSSVKVNDEKFAFMYIWMLGIHDSSHVYYGRTWEEFVIFLKQIQEFFHLDDIRKMIIYIHNMAFDFQFFRKYFNWLEVFATDDRKPIKATCDIGIEFRDSLILSNLSLEKLAENLTSHKIQKLTGNLDYNLIRTSETPLSEDELAYCEHDIVILLYYINEQILMYQNDITKVPLTNTGRVRQYIRDECFHTSKNHHKDNPKKYSQYRKMMKTLTLEVDEYIMLKQAFQGGFTHANVDYYNKILDNVTSFDFTSSYPAVMLSEKFPMSKGQQITIEEMKEMFPGSADPFQELCKNFCVLFEIKYYHIQTKICDCYLSESRCRNIVNCTPNNGRVFSADELETTITDIDYFIIQDCYNYDRYEIRMIYYYNMGYLPKPIITSILKFYQDKTELKGIPEKIAEYNNSKNMLNSCYGMCVTDLVRDSYLYSDHTWTKEKPTLEECMEQIETYNHNRQRFLFYPWGVWVTAYARRNLFLGIVNCGKDYVYSDTDSIKILNAENHLDFISWYNKEITKKLEKMCDWYQIDKNLLKPKNQKGTEKPLGVWENEGTYLKFKTLGAKRYLTYDGKNLKLTVAGLSKQNGIQYLKKKYHNNVNKIFKAFHKGLSIPAEQTGKMTHTYIDDEMTEKVTDYLGKSVTVTSLSSVHLEPAEYNLEISKDFNRFIYDIRHGYFLQVGRS